MKKFYLKRILKIVCFFMFVFTGVFFLCKTIEKTSGFNLDGAMNSVYENKNKYEIIAIGSSTMYTLYSPEYADAVTGVDSVNLGSAVQNMDDTYYLLKEVYKYQKPEYILIGTGVGRIGSNDDSYGSGVALASMRNSLNRLWFFISDFSVKDVLKLFRINTEKFSIKDLLNGNYISYFFEVMENPPEQSVNLSDGFFYTESKFENTETSSWGYAVSESAEEYLIKTIELCQKNGSKVILLNPPISPVQFKTNDTTDQYQEYFNNIAAQYGIENWDLSFLKKEVISYNTENFGDHMHTNGKGGTAYSSVLGEILKSYLDGNFVYDDFFYSTHSECIEGQQL